MTYPASKPSNLRKYAEKSERPDPGKGDRSGFLGNSGHADPTPPGGENPGGKPGEPSDRPHPRDYVDVPSDPRASADDVRPDPNEDRK